MTSIWLVEHNEGVFEDASTDIDSAWNTEDEAKARIKYLEESQAKFAEFCEAIGHHWHDNDSSWHHYEVIIGKEGLGPWAVPMVQELALVEDDKPDYVEAAEFVAQALALWPNNKDEVLPEAEERATAFWKWQKKYFERLRAESDLREAQRKVDNLKRQEEIQREAAKKRAKRDAEKAAKRAHDEAEMAKRGITHG